MITSIKKCDYFEQSQEDDDEEEGEEEEQAAAEGENDEDQEGSGDDNTPATQVSALFKWYDVALLLCFCILLTYSNVVFLHTDCTYENLKNRAICHCHIVFT